MGTLFAVTATKEFLYFARDDQEPPQLTLEDAAKEAIDDSDLWDEIETIEVLNPADELTSDALAEIAYGDREGDASVADLIKNGFLVRKPEPTARARPLVFPPEYENIQKYYPKTLVREVLHPNRGRGFWVKDTYFSPEAARLFSTRVLSSTNTKNGSFIRVEDPDHGLVDLKEIWAGPQFIPVTHASSKKDGWLLMGPGCHTVFQDMYGVEIFSFEWVAASSDSPPNQEPPSWKKVEEPRFNKRYLQTREGEVFLFLDRK